MASTRKKTADAAPNADPTDTAPAEPEPRQAPAAYARFAEERQALGPAVEPPQGDLNAALETARKALPKIQGLRDAIVEALPRHNIQLTDNLGDYILAARFAERLTSLTANTEAGADKFNEMIEKGRNTRGVLISGAEFLVKRGLFDEAKVKAIRSGAGHEDLAADLLDLAALYEEAWGKLKGKGIIEREEIDEASKLGNELQLLLTLRKADTKLTPEETKEQLARAVVLLVRAYDETARAIAYVRWHEKDADSITPALFKAKRGRPPKGETTASPPPVVEAEDPSRVDEPPDV